jgi:hypothetical protein
MEALEKAIARRQLRDPKFTGTDYAVATECGKGVCHQQIQNLRMGETPPWRIRVSTMQALCRVFHDLQPQHFYQPRERQEKAA